jgi:hypothetical protein
MRKSCFALLFLFLGHFSAPAHSLQGTFSSQEAWTYRGQVYSSTGFTEFTNLPDGQVVATSRRANGDLVSIKNFFPSGAFSSTNYDDNSVWTGTWKLQGKRVTIRGATTDGHRAQIVWTLRNGAIRMSGVHFYQNKRIGRGTGLLRPL